MKRFLSIISFYLVIVPFLYAQDNHEQITVWTSCVYMDYCTSSDSALQYAKEQGISIMYPLLVVNGVIVQNDEDINIIRKSIHGHKRMLGPYHIAKYKRYTQKQASRFQIKDVPKDGLLMIYLKRNEILDFANLENWNSREMNY